MVRKQLSQIKAFCLKSRSVAVTNARLLCFPIPTRKLRYCLNDEDIKKKKEITGLKLNISELNNIENFYNQTELNLGCMQNFIPE